jgi:hypothetical protein
MDFFVKERAAENKIPIEDEIGPAKTHRELDDIKKNKL